MRPHTHTRRAAHAPASHLEPRSRSPSCAKRVYVTSPKRHTRHGSCARTARSSQRTQDTTHDTHSDEPCPDSHADADTQSRHADADTQTRASNEARNDGPLRQRARELRHRVLGDVHAVVLPAPSARSAAAAAATDLLRRRFQGRSSWIQFVASFSQFVLEKRTPYEACVEPYQHVTQRGATSSRASTRVYRAPSPAARRQSARHRATVTSRAPPVSGSS